MISANAQVSNSNLVTKSDLRNFEQWIKNNFATKAEMQSEYNTLFNEIQTIKQHVDSLSSGLSSVTNSTNVALRDLANGITPLELQTRVIK